MRGPQRAMRLAVPVLVLAMFGAGCSSTDSKCKVDKSYTPRIEAGAFVAEVTNPFCPLRPGTVLIYAEGEDTVEVTVLADKETILGVPCTIVHDVLRSGTEVIEDTYDWFAQDTAGAIWYFGEDTKEMSGGQVVSTEGSWEAGVDGAQPGIIIPAHPSVGQQYRQEYYACVAEDMGQVLDLNASVVVPNGSFTYCLKTRDFTPLEPAANENKYYFPGIGLLLTVDLTNGTREELVRVIVPIDTSSSGGC